MQICIIYSNTGSFIHLSLKGIDLLGLEGLKRCCSLGRPFCRQASPTQARISLLRCPFV
jgi:hypothetical protein